MDTIATLVDNMDPEEALKALSEALRKLFGLLDKDVRSRFLLALIEESGGDKLSGMVHL